MAVGGDGADAVPDALDGLVTTAVDQFLRGAHPHARRDGPDA
ncbi:hypothetical protein [Streptomyces zingiberis]|nr:hypothetical protein [Streptomyces zingiberis]